MTTIREILARKEQIRIELRGILDANPAGDLSDEQRSRADILEQEAGRLNDQERRVALIDDLDRRAAGTPIGTKGDDRLDGELGKVGLLDCIRSQPGISDRGAGLARELSS